MVQITERPSQTRTRAFDSLAYARSLESVGFTRAQAEMLAEKQSELIDDRLATKEDIAAVRGDIESLRLGTQKDIESLRLETQKDMESLRLGTQKDIESLRLETQKDIAAVRGDIESLRLGTQKDMESLRLGTQKDIAEAVAKSESAIIRWMFGTVGLQTLALLGALFGLAHMLKG